MQDDTRVLNWVHELAAQLTPQQIAKLLGTTTHLKTGE